MQAFTQSVIEIILNIPYGRVMTYGQIAALAGSPRAARQVVRVLHSMSAKFNLPWHRVVNVHGKIGLSGSEGYDIQKSLLAAEGVTLGPDGVIDLDEFQFWPE